MKRNFITYPNNFSSFLMDDIVTSFNSIVNDAMTSMSEKTSEQPLTYSNGYPKVNIKNFEDKFVIEATVPGLAKEEVTVSVREGDLIISGGKRLKSNKNNFEVIWKEIKESSFTRVIKLPIKMVNIKEIKSRIENGLLYIDIPKKEKEELFINVTID